MNNEKQRQLDEINRPRHEELFNSLEKQYQELAKVKAESEQIEEMAKIFCGMKNGCDGCMWDKVHCKERNCAEALYNAGYRKQSKGEWRGDFDGDCYCTACGYYPKKDVKNFCPNCGAKMKGGAG